MWIVLSRFIRLTKKWSNFIERLGKSLWIWNHWKRQNDKSVTTFFKNQSLQQSKPRLLRLVFISPCLSRYQQEHNNYVYNNLGALHSKIVVSMTTLMTIFFFKIISLKQLVNFYWFRLNYESIWQHVNKNWWDIWTSRVCIISTN